MTRMFLSVKHPDSHSSLSGLLMAQWEAQGSSPDIQLQTLSLEPGFFLLPTLLRMIASEQGKILEVSLIFWMSAN